LRGDITLNGESVPGAEVLSGLAATEQIIKTNLGTLRLAVPVKIIGANPAQSSAAASAPASAPVSAPASAPTAALAPVKG